MLNFNKVIFGGHVTSDPTLRPVGTSNVANFSVAANYKRKKQDGTYSEEVCFLEVEAWGNKADVAVKFLKKGDQVMVEGRLKQSNWEDKTGNKRSKLSLSCEEIFLIGNNDRDKSKPSPSAANTIAKIKGAGFEVTKTEVRRIDEPASKSKEIIDDLPF